ncbi:MAG: sigma-70 family RNA polymerase sigma factor [Planctomycetes bacterium]|nr:sigma-70 family RNA polymerase sigma factor [Planctomycetota bacterium]
MALLVHMPLDEATWRIDGPAHARPGWSLPLSPDYNRAVMKRPTDVAELLQRWNDGDNTALGELLTATLPWLRAHVSRRLGGLLRRVGDTQDYVHDAALDALRSGPKFVVEDEACFRALLSRIVENTLRDRIKWHGAQKRDLKRQERLATGSAIVLDPSLRSVTRPSEAAQTNETRAWMALALELLDPDDRRVLVLRAIDELPFKEVAARMNTTVSTAQMRFARALPKLRDKIVELQDGRAARVLRSIGEVEPQ